MPSADVAKKLCLELIHADTEEEVVSILQSAGFWGNAAVWRDLGDEPENYSTVGNQQSRAEQALIEKLINSIDTKLIAAALSRGIDPESQVAPKSMIEARDTFFGQELKNPEALSRDITVAATGHRAPGKPSISIADNGEGQTPSSMPMTILSVLKGSKKRIPFVQGKFHMGGTGVLEFCGQRHNVQLVVSKRDPKLLPLPATDNDAHWSFTIVRREDPAPGAKSSRFTFLAPGPVGSDGKHTLLSFDVDTLPIFPEKNRAYDRAAKWGTLFKLYEYDIRAKTNMMLADGLLRRAALLLPEPALPIRFHECRAGFRGDPERSFDTTMIGLVGTLDASYRNPKREHVEWFDKFEIDAQGERFTCRIYVFKDKDAAENYRKDEGVVFAYNGQCHAIFTKDFFRRNSVKQDYLWHSLLVVVDCSAISTRAHERLFMPSRDRLRNGDLKRDLEDALEDNLKTHQKLKEMASERRNRERAAQPEVSETFKNFLEEMVKKNPLLASILGPGFRIRNPHRPLIVAADVKEWVGVRFPTRFHFKGLEQSQELARDAHLNSHIRVSLETDAEDEYFSRVEQPGTFTLFQVVNGASVHAKNWKSPNLYHGTANFSLALPPAAAMGEVLTYEAVITDPSRVDPFRNRLVLRVKAERESPPPPPPPQDPLKPPRERKTPTGKPGDEREDDSQLDIPEPIEVYEKDWLNHEPPFDRTTAMVIKEPPGVEDDKVIAYDYYVNVDNVFLQAAQKEAPKRAAVMKARFKHGMTLVSLALIQHDIEAKRLGAAKKTPDEENGGDGDNREGKREDVRDSVGNVTSALAPFILPLIESLSALNEESESLSSSAGDAA